MSDALAPLRIGPASIRWSLAAGVYLFLWALAVVMLLDDVLFLLAEVIGLPMEFWSVILAGPALFNGAFVWLFAVELRDSYSYVLGAAAGLLTAVLTSLLWTLRFVTVWGTEMLTVHEVGLLVAVVGSLASVAGVLAGVPLMGIRRRRIVVSLDTSG